MEQTRYVNLPLVGRIQHGERTDKKVIELGYFIAKIDETYMQVYLEKFNKQYKGKQSIDIEFFNEQPLTMKYARFNQSGEVCSCNVQSDMANQKTKNGWQQIACNSECEYRQKDKNGKCACNRIGWLKFLIPSICKDRIFLMKISGQTSLNRLNDYFNLQKAQGNSIIGKYTLFLKQEEQTNSLGKKFNNYVLDIFRNDNFIQTNNLPQTTEKTTDLSTKTGKSVDNYVVKTENSQNIAQASLSNTKETQKQTTKNTNRNEKNIKKKETNSNAQKIEAKQTQITDKEINITNNETVKKAENSKNEFTNSDTNTVENFNNCYALLKTFTKTLVNKEGQSKEYLIGEFADTDDKISQIVIRPEDASELAECDLGTLVKLDITEKGNKKFALKLEYIEKAKKLVA